MIILLKVTGVMRGNIGAVLNRGNNLSELQDRFCSCRNMKKNFQIDRCQVGAAEHFK